MVSHLVSNTCPLAYSASVHVHMYPEINALTEPPWGCLYVELPPDIGWMTWSINIVKRGKVELQWLVGCACGCNQNYLDHELVCALEALLSRMSHAIGAGTLGFEELEAIRRVLKENRCDVVDSLC